MKKVIPAALAAALLLCCTGCSSNEKPLNDTQIQQTGNRAAGENAVVLPPSPWHEHKTLDELKKAVNFPVSFPESIEGMPITFLQEMGNNAEVRYNDGKITLRKGTGTDDISGDYNEYPEVKTLDGSITAKGEDDLIKLAVWTDGEYSYAICSEGISEERVLEIASDMQNDFSESGMVAPPSPWHEHKTFDELKNAVNFPVSFPESIDGMPITFLQEMGNNAEVRYNDGKITLRKGTGTDDISGDYNEYPEVKTLDENITAKGEGGLIKLAVWTDGEYSYAICSEGISEEKVLEIAALI